MRWGRWRVLLCQASSTLLDSDHHSCIKMENGAERLPAPHGIPAASRSWATFHILLLTSFSFLSNSIEGYPGEITLHQVTSHFHLHHCCATHARIAMTCARAQGEKGMHAMTPVEVTRRGAGEKGCTDICSCFTEQGIVYSFHGDWRTKSQKFGRL